MARVIRIHELFTLINLILKKAFEIASPPLYGAVELGKVGPLGPLKLTDRHSILKLAY
jgi:hypothetical protein